jgi:hypothetical protein
MRLKVVPSRPRARIGPRQAMMAEDEKSEATSPLEQTCLLLGCGLLGRCLLGGGSSLLGLDDLGNLLWLGGLDDTATLGLGQLDRLGLLRYGRGLYGCQ